MATMSKVEASSLPKKLDLGKRRLARLLEELNQLLEKRAAVREIEEQLRMSEEHYRQVEECEEELESTLDDDEANMEMDKWSKFRQAFREGKAKAVALIEELRAVDVASKSMGSAEADKNMSLPQCSLPKFDGDIVKFREFWNQFEGWIHQQKNLTDSMKLLYLRDCLTGEALETIAGLSQADTDYSVAIQMIRERYDRPAIAARRLLFNLVSMAWKEWDVKTLFEHLNQNVEALTAFGKDPRTSKVTAAECLIVLARELLPFRTKIKWDEVAASDESAHSDLSRFLQFLQDRLK
ncbi:hypothetical protein T10_1480 [Trichinella papuae]|uniref:Uncharacterized protein n=1 Tax=Trichinella papuae TaxID=268474 RepID=A0A0V1MJA4_9BILA|nr:hypothetical protein T10_1480 [Trichinella papuae]